MEIADDMCYGLGFLSLAPASCSKLHELGITQLNSAENQHEA
jgi:hypothetical protein